MPERVRITDVSPRDGLQNEAAIIAAASKAELVRLVADAGVDEVEITSFVSAKWVPQLGDAAEVCRLVSGMSGLPMLSALVPNERGMAGLLEANAAAGRRLISKASVFTAASETFARKNTNASVAETIERFGPVVRMAREQGIRVRGYVSCAVACPFEGAIAPAAVVDVVRRLVDLGVDEIDVADTIGAGTPETVGAMLEAVMAAMGGAWTGAERFTLHLHDTFGRAGACVERALELGVRSFDGSVAGLGGCPYASTPGRRAPGNIATETLVRVVHRAGFVTGVDEAKLSTAGARAGAMVASARAGEDAGGGAR